ncbi:MAG: hypothetical protein R3C28_04690 [Pirellulaceae bacterium]
MLLESNLGARCVLLLDEYVLTLRVTLSNSVAICLASQWFCSYMMVNRRHRSSGMIK